MFRRRTAPRRPRALGRDHHWAAAAGLAQAADPQPATDTVPASKAALVAEMLDNYDLEIDVDAMFGKAGGELTKEGGSVTWARTVYDGSSDAASV